MLVASPTESQLIWSEVLSSAVLIENALFKHKLEGAMTVMLDHTSEIMGKLIESCCHAREGFRSAADVVENQDLKRLFGIYAQQRTRFAEELREYFPMELDDPAGCLQPRRGLNSRPTTAELLKHCLEVDRQTLIAYELALKERDIPTKAHFLISAQSSLLKRVLERMHGLLKEAANASTTERSVL
jgi:hypothetical protein